MAKINTATRNYSVVANATVNQDGNLAFKMPEKTELMTRVATCFWAEPKFYGDVSSQSKAIIDLAVKIAEQDPLYVFKLASYTRQVLNLRTVSVVLYVIACNSTTVKGKALARTYAPFVISRADEVAEALAFQFACKGSKNGMPNNMRRALADSLNSFNSYELAKYDHAGAAVKMKDAIRILHPVPSNESQAKLYKQILEGTLEAPETWEVAISTKGSTTENWNKIVPKMGYFALVRNLRNLLDKQCDMAPVITRLRDKNSVLKSKMLPFRFYSAYRMLVGNSNPFSGSVLTALCAAMDYAIENVPELPGVTVIAIDHSGSMNSALSEHSDVSVRDAADALAAIARAKSRLCIVMEYADEAKFINVASNGVMGTLNAIKQQSTSGVTNAEDVFIKLRQQNVRADRVIVLSDQQDNQGHACRGWLDYRLRFPGARLYSVDLAGYGTSQFIPEHGVVQLAGFSEKIFQFVGLAEQGFDEMVKRIENYDFAKPPAKTSDNA